MGKPVSKTPTRAAIHLCSSNAANADVSLPEILALDSENHVKERPTLLTNL
jgi:hypothetical protein